MYSNMVEMATDNARIGKIFDKIIHEFKAYKYNHINYWDQYFDRNYVISSYACSLHRPHIKLKPVTCDDVFRSKYIPAQYYIIIHIAQPKSVPFVGNIIVCKMAQSALVEKPHTQSCVWIGDHIMYNKKALVDAVMRFAYSNL